MSRKIFSAVVVCCLLISVLLISHRSERSTVVFSRYSVSYFVFLLGYHSVLIISIISYFKREKLLIRLKKIGSSLANFSFSSFIKNNYNKLFLAIIIWQIIGVLIYFPPQMVFSSQPIMQKDFALHYYQATSFIEAITKNGKHWAYDPNFAAGFPSGTLSDVSFKLFEVIIFGLSKLGVNPAFAFNSLIIVSYSLIPMIIHLVCQHFECSKIESFWVVLSGVLFWQSNRWTIAISTEGMFSYMLVVYWSLLCTSLFFRFISTEKFADYLFFVLAISLGFMLHISLPVLLIIPFGVLYLLNLKKIKPISHMMIILAILIVLMVNSRWISTLLRFWHYRIDTEISFETQSVSAFFRSLPMMATQIDAILLLLGIWGFFNILTRRKNLALLGIFSVIWFFLLGKVGSNIPVIESLQPRRFSIPANIFALFGLILGVQEPLQNIKFQKISIKKVFPILILPLLVVLQLFVPRWYKNTCNHCGPNNINGILPLVSWVNDNTTKESRIAYIDLTSHDFYFSVAALTYFVDREFINCPYNEVNLTHNYLTITELSFLNKDIFDLTQYEFLKYADLFNIKWIISTDKKVSKIFDTFTPTVKKVEEIPGRTTFSIYEIDRKPDYFLVGSGKLTSELNKITIQNAGSNETIIKYHWLETLAVKPELPLEKYEIDKSPIGFIKVDNGDIRDFVIYNTYEFNSGDSQGIFNKIGRYLDILNLSYGK